MDASHKSLDRVFEILSDHRRRYVLYYLNNPQKQTVTLDELADQVCTWEREWIGRTNKLKGNHRENIRIQLHHIHLPKMDDAGAIDYDPRSQTVRSHTAESLLELIDQDSNECPRLETLFTSAEV